MDCEVTSVRKAGDDAVHMSPGLSPDPTTILSDLVKVLEQMERRGTQSA